MSRRVERHRDVFEKSAQNTSNEGSDETERVLDERRAEGWRLVAVEWQRETPDSGPESRTLVEVPYGLKVAEDSVHLTTAVEEHEAMTLMLDLLVADRSMQSVADELNLRGFAKRDGALFTQVDIFELVPRLVEIAPEVFATSTWKDLRVIRKRIQSLA